MTRVTTMELDEAETFTEEKPRPKVGRLPVNLRLLNENERDVAFENSSQATRKGDTQFMLLLVMLFIIVNLTLITLLNHKDKTPAAKPEVAATHEAAPAPVAATPAAPVAVAPPALKLELPPAQAAIPVAPSAAVAAPVLPVAPPVANAYVTPASTGSKTTAAPFQPVTVSEHASPVAVATTVPNVNVTEPLTVVHTPYPAPPVAPASELAPAAGTPAVSPETAKQDLLSVLNKD